MSFTYNKPIQEMKIAGYHFPVIPIICHLIWKVANKITLTSKIKESFYFGNGKQEWTLTFTLGSGSVPSSIYTSQFSLAFKCVPKVTRVSNCFSVRVVITDFKAVIYITRGSTVSFNLNRKKTLNNRKTSRDKRMNFSFRPNFIVN